MATGVKAVYPAAVLADEIKFGVQLTRPDPSFSLMAREFSLFILVFALACGVVSHVAMKDRGQRGLPDTIGTQGKNIIDTRTHAPAIEHGYACM